MTTTPAGRINRLFGTGGSVMLSLYGTFPDDFDPVQTPLLVTIDSLEVPLWCERFERRGATGAVAAFADLDTDRRAQELLGLEFRIPETEEEDEDDEFYLEDLIGFAVEAEEIRGQDACTEDARAEDARAEDARDKGSQAPENRTEAHAGGPRKLRGTVTDYYDSELNPLFGLEIEGREVLIPAAEEFIAHIDFARRTMHLVLPEGLLDL